MELTLPVVEALFRDRQSVVRTFVCFLLGCSGRKKNAILFFGVAPNISGYFHPIQTDLVTVLTISVVPCLLQMSTILRDITVQFEDDVLNFTARFTQFFMVSAL